MTDERLKGFLDDDGKLIQYPTKWKIKFLALRHLASKFEPGKSYTEKEVNTLLKQWHTFGDWALLRRDLYDLRFLGREANGSRYWLEETPPTGEEFGIPAKNE